MTDRPILFSALMIRALLAGRKTQTRRLATSKPTARIAVGDRLWVRENCRACEGYTGLDYIKYPADGGNLAIEDNAAAASRWLELDSYAGKRGALVPSIHMPRWASRITLTVTDTRTQRLGAITEADARAEGIEQQRGRDGTSWFLDPNGDACAFASSAYASLWNSLHTAPETRWEDSPEIIAISFSVAIRNIDA